ncbi:hypothetical protein ACFONL_00155 [Camelimonas fluminis]|uniref:Uncharacterized protein n=1 Tax=Camelimonas fluminis TaxID=1576911 RepID=A0ABV7UBD2_9HYPH
MIEALGGTVQFAKDVGCSVSTASSWKIRNSIPPRYWPRVVDIARYHRVPGISFETLAGLAAQKERRAS